MNREVPIKVRFNDIGEIRMGSPFNYCSVELKGEYIPEIQRDGYLNIYKWSENFNYLALARWNISKDNEPAFYLYIIDIANRRLIRSDSILGCCRRIEFNKNRFECSVFMDAGYDDLMVAVELTGKTHTIG